MVIGGAAGYFRRHLRPVWAAGQAATGLRLRQPRHIRQLRHVGDAAPGHFSFRGVAPVAPYPPLGDPELVCADSAQRLRRTGPWQAQL